MVFSTPFFLFFFLPLTLILVFITRNSSYKNLVLLIVSVLFYIFGEGELVLLMFGSITLNFFLGKWVGNCSSKTAIIIGITVNLAILIVFKYAAFMVQNINILLTYIGIIQLPIPKIKLPAGISFYTFHSISYLIDVYRKDNKFQKSYVDMALYIALFPQLIAGPIIRYKDIAYQFTMRKFKTAQFQMGIQRFIIGLGKKIIIANTLGYTVDNIYRLSPHELDSQTAWLAIVAYSLQLYFDFSGYSDMAIGLAKMVGFDFLENFNFPYKAKSIKEFWSRWHISLSNWFRDYLYIPLGGNRVTASRMYLNLIIVFFLTGFWHGASYNFILWGMIHGFFMVAERLFLQKILIKTGIVQHVYTLMVVMLAWVFFRVDNFEAAKGVITTAFNWSTNNANTAAIFITNELIITGIIAVLLAFNGANLILKRLFKMLLKKYVNQRYFVKTAFRTSKHLFLLLIFVYAIMYAASGSYNPFIYFRF